MDTIEQFQKLEQQIIKTLIKDIKIFIKKNNLVLKRAIFILEADYYDAYIVVTNQNKEEFMLHLLTADNHVCKLPVWVNEVVEKYKKIFKYSYMTSILDDVINHLDNHKGEAQ